MAIENWMPTLRNNMQALLDADQGQAHKYDELPASIQDFPTLILLPTAGSQVYSQGGGGVAVHQVQMTLYLAAQVLPEAYATAVPYIKKVRDTLAAHYQLGGLVDDCAPLAPPANWYEGPGGIKYGDKELLGIIFHIWVKERENVTVAI